MNDHGVLAWISENRERLSTPLYLYAEDALERSIDFLSTLLPRGARLFYSLKANPQPALVRWFFSRNIRPEVASEGELSTCTGAGVPPKDVLIGGVAKSVAYLRRLCESGSYAVVIDSRSEWDRLSSINRPTHPARVLLRLNPGIALGGLDMGGPSQFGLAVDDAIAIARSCRETLHQFSGVHCYFGSQRLKPEPILRTVDIMTDVIRQFFSDGVEPRIVDIGLGCGVPYLEKDNDLDRAALAEQLAERWSEPIWSRVSLWSEAGRALAGPAGFYVTRVIERKQLNGKTFVFVDGGLNTHNPGIGLGRFFKSNPQFAFATKEGDHERETVEIVGMLCTAADRLGYAVAAPRLQAGDLVVVPNAGAYCQTTALWGFNSQRLFNEAMLGSDGRLRPVEAQYGSFLRACTLDKGPKA
jgi:diaminopimelate decarboxylase